jgi:SAM-dependent methyltransferase
LSLGEAVFLVLCDRNVLIQYLPKNAVWAEVGVYRGDFSQMILEQAKPAELYLIDSWRYDLKELNPFSDTPENFSAFRGKIHWDHFGDDPQGAQDRNFDYVRSRFAGAANVNVIRANSVEGIQGLTDGHFDVIYIDANHQYEYALRDMMEARKKLKPGGILLLNDFYEGPGGAEQNLGVVGATNTFVKRYDFHYVAMTYGSYADLAVTEDPGSEFVKEFLDNLKNSALLLIGLPDAIVPNMRYKVYRKPDGELRYLPLF